MKLQTVHVLGKQRAAGPARFARLLTDDEFEPIRRVGLPVGWLAWHIANQEPRKMNALRVIPVMVQAGTMTPIDPFVELGSVDIRYEIEATPIVYAD